LLQIFLKHKGFPQLYYLAKNVPLQITGVTDEKFGNPYNKSVRYGNRRCSPANRCLVLFITNFRLVGKPFESVFEHKITGHMSQNNIE